MIKQGDKIVFKVKYVKNNELYSAEFNSFELAKQTLINLNCIGFLDFTASQDGSSVTASLMKRTKMGQIEVIHNHYLKQLGVS